ncbi:MAG: DUF2059 domain-containing protein [Arenimonas sp.]|nr:DUF2059 domain-containing protein [Arenimonas sp.]
MKIINTLLLALLLAGSHATLANPGDEREAVAAELLDSLGMDQALKDVTGMILDMQLESHPELEPYRGIMSEFFGRHMSYAALREELVDIYVAEFTIEELRAARDFYASPEGKRFVSLQSRLMQMGGELGERRVNENAAELEAAITAEKARLAAASGDGKAESIKK